MEELTPGRRAVAAATAFLIAAGLAGISPREHTTVYRVFGLTEGLLALLLTFVLLERRVWQHPGALGWVSIAYATVASAQILALLLPPAGALQWLCVIGVLFVLLASFAVISRTRLLAILGGASVLLALLRFSVVPFVWERSGPGPGEAVGIGSALEGLRRLVVEHQPESTAAQLFGLIAIGMWIIGTRLLWAADGAEDPPRPDWTPPSWPADPDDGTRGF